MIATDCDGWQWQQIHAEFPHLTYRQFDYWSRSGRIVSHFHDAAGGTYPSGGSGWVRCWPKDQVKLLRRYVVLCFWGLGNDNKAMPDLHRLATDRAFLAEFIRDLTEIETDLLEEAAR